MERWRWLSLLFVSLSISVICLTLYLSLLFVSWTVGHLRPRQAGLRKQPERTVGEAGGTAKQPESGQWAASEAGGAAKQPEGQWKVGRPHPHQDPAAPPKMDRWKSAPRETAPLAPQREVAQSLSPFSPFY